MDVERFPTLCGITVRTLSVVIVSLRVFYADAAPSFAVAVASPIVRGHVDDAHVSHGSARRSYPLPIATGLEGSGGYFDVYYTVFPDAEGLVSVALRSAEISEHIVTWQPSVWIDGVLIYSAWPHVGDFNGDGFTNGDDLDVFLAAFVAGGGVADLNCDGFANGEDFDLFMEAWS